MATGPYFGVHGDRVVGPFHLWPHVKQALNMPEGTKHDQRIVNGELYRYGAKFIGTERALVANNLMKPRARTERGYTHVRLMYGVDVNGTIQTRRTGPWQEI